MGRIENQLNYYGYIEDAKFTPKTCGGNYDVTISANDKILSLTEDGELLANIGLTYANNILTLNGKEDGLEIASIELPNSLVELTTFALEEGEDGKEIVLSFLQSDGTTTSLSLNVEELAVVYKAGAGLSLSDDNTFSIKLKNGSLLGFTAEEELDINLDGAYPTIQQVTDEFTKYNNKLININGNIRYISGVVSSMTESIDGTISATTALGEQINSIMPIISGMQEDIEELQNKEDNTEAIKAWVIEQDYAINSAVTEQVQIMGNETLESAINSAKTWVNNQGFVTNVEVVSTSQDAIILAKLWNLYRENGDYSREWIVSKLQTMMVNNEYDAPYDINGDGKISMLDVNIVLNRLEEAETLAHYFNEDVVPTKVSAFENDKGYLVADDLNEWNDKFDQLRELAEWIDGNDDAQKILEVTSDVTKLKSDVEYISGATSANTEDIARIDESLASILNDYVTSVQLGDEIDELEAADEEIRNSIQTLSDSIAEVSGSIVPQVEVDLTPYVKKVELSPISEQVSLNKASLALQSAEMIEQRGKLQTIEGDITNATTNIATLQSYFENWNQDLIETGERINRLEQRIVVLENFKLATETKIADIISRLENLENK